MTDSFDDLAAAAGVAKAEAETAEKAHAPDAVAKRRHADRLREQLLTEADRLTR